ncbi:MULTISPECIES: hypothetical protein [unclassified Microcoleus]|uniref:hypothetical protein n=1 Tax=unclassified Microcoleus TaxID=2642155 RepID=UPI001DD378EB|nr:MULTISPECIES: hypothetical protein [unclassified Microcoleus]MCC3446462.1 hypothetical protein [Microcoleus sp. PH2017_09_SFU_O_A]
MPVPDKLFERSLLDLTLKIERNYRSTKIICLNLSAPIDLLDLSKKASFEQQVLNRQDACSTIIIGKASFEQAGCLFHNNYWKNKF